MADESLTPAVAMLLKEMTDPASPGSCDELTTIPESPTTSQTWTEPQPDLQHLRFECEYCDKVLATKMGMKMHTRQHTKEFPYACSQCSKGFNTRVLLKAHLAKHQGKPYATCKLCGKALASPSALKRHHALHEGTTLKCEYCEKTFHTKDSHSKHQISHQTKTERCQLCGKYFHEKTINKHMREIHGEKKHQCELCPYATNRKADLMRHGVMHKPTKIEICSSCGKDFKWETSRRRHEEVCQGPKEDEDFDIVEIDPDLLIQCSAAKK